MASAVLASGNEQKWGNTKGFKKNYPPNRALIRSRSNIFSNFQNPSSEISRFHHSNAPPPRQNAHIPKINNDFQVSDNVENNLYGRDILSFDLGSLSRYNVKSLKNRLIMELKCVRGILKRIEAHEIESRGKVSMALARPLEGENSGEGKSGKVLGKKRVKTGAPVRESKRRVVDSPRSKVKVTSMKKCREALVKLMNLKSAVAFNQPVDVEGLKLPDYNMIIKNPMDLGTIKSKLEKGKYRTLKAFAADVRLTFDNAMVYNHKGSKVYVAAEKLLVRFEQLFDPISKNYEAQVPSVKQPAKPVPEPLSDFAYNLQQLQSVGMNSTFSKVSMESKADIVPVSENPVSKSRGLMKREMRIEEKEDLVEQLQEMSPEVAARMVHILRGRNPNLMLEGDEIELDMEALDVETLWELERFVASYKNGSKIKEQEKTENLSSVSELKKRSPVIVLEPDNVEMDKKRNEVEEDVDIGEEILVDDFPSVEIEKDVAAPNTSGSSSSRSSSDSDSPSSTDSDSSSSSSSDSEEAGVQAPFVEPGNEAHGAGEV